MKKLRIKLPSPHSMQSEIENCNKKRVIICAGRQAGKTFMVTRKAIKEAGNGKRVLYIAPVMAQTDVFWDLAKTWLSDGILINQVIKNETKRTLKFTGGGQITAKTGNTPDNLRGDNYDFIILDEYAYQNPEIWNKVIQPMVLQTNGTVWFISTPNFRNHFYTLYLKAIEDDTWAYFHFSSLRNPHLHEDSLAQLAADMTEGDYKQEILAEFLPGEGQIFKLYKEDFIPSCSIEEHKYHRIVAGLDWGIKGDYTSVSIGCATCARELQLHRFRGFDYPEQLATLKQLITTDMEILAESNSMGLPNIHQLRNDGFPIIEFSTTNQSKQLIVQQLGLALSQRNWKWVIDEVGYRELEGYERRLTPLGHITYSAPQNGHDDTVISRCLMLHQALTGQFTTATVDW